MSKQRLICVSCEKRGPVQSFCEHCGHPTVAASYEERIFWEMGQWESSRARQGIAPKPAVASPPPSHPASGRRPAERAPQGPDIAAVTPRPAPAPPKPSTPPARPAIKPIAPQVRPAATTERATPLRSVPAPPARQVPPARPNVQRPAAATPQSPAAQAPDTRPRPRPLIPRPTRPLSQTGATMIEQVAPARLDEPADIEEAVEAQAPQQVEDDNRVLLIRRLERIAEPADVEDDLQQDLESLETMLDEQVVEAETEELPLEAAPVKHDRKAARAEAKQQKAAARIAAKQAQRTNEEARKLAEAEAKAVRDAELEQERAADEEAERAAEATKREAAIAKEAAKREADDAKEAAKRQKKEDRIRPAATVAGPKLNRRDRGFQRDIETLGLVEGETVTMSLRGRAFGPATMIVTNYRVAVVGGRRTSVRWIPFEEVNQIDTMWRGAPTVLIGGTVEVLRFRMRSAQKLSAIVRTLMTDVQASKVPGSAHHHAELTQAWCDKAGEVWDSQTGRIRLFIRRHPAFTLSWLTTLIPIAYFAAR